MLLRHRSRRKIRSRTRKGFTLLATAFAAIGVIYMLGVAIDFGRVFLAKNEAQTFADSSSLAATKELDGTAAGITRARMQASSNPNRWDFARTAFSGAGTSFAKQKSGPWESNPTDPRDYRYAKVDVSVPVPLTFLPMVGLPPATALPVPMAFLIPQLQRKLDVSASSAAGQELRTRFREGLFPFSPLAHNTTGPHFGLLPGVKYTLRWAASPRLNGNNVCEGDRIQAMIDLAEAGGGSERGFIEETSASTIRQAIVYDYQTVFRSVGDAVNMTGGAKQTQRDAVIERINQDWDTLAETYADYMDGGVQNGRRLIGAPINTGFPDYRIVQIGAFLLGRQNDYPQGGNKPFCAEYVGAWVQGSRNKGAADAGSYVTRLIQ